MRGSKFSFLPLTSPSPSPEGRGNKVLNLMAVPLAGEGEGVRDKALGWVEVLASGSAGGNRSGPVAAWRTRHTVLTGFAASDAEEVCALAIKSLAEPSLPFV
jgi:hypothetical protein